MVTLNHTSSINNDLLEIKQSLEAQTKAYLPQISQKCNKHMTSLLATLTNNGSIVPPDLAQNVYSELTQESYQKLFTSPPSIFLRLFHWAALKNWEEGSNLALKIQASCLLPFKETICRRLDILLTSDITSEDLKKAATDLNFFLNNPDHHIPLRTTFSLLKEENIFPEDLDFEKDKDLIDLQLCLKNNCFSEIAKIPNPTLQTFKENAEKVVTIMHKVEKTTSISQIDKILKNSDLTSYASDLSKHFHGDPLAFKSFLLHSTRSFNPSLSEALATKITNIVIPHKDVSQDNDILHWSNKSLVTTEGTLLQTKEACYILLAKLLSKDPLRVEEANSFLENAKAETKTLKMTAFLKTFAYWGVYDDFSTAIYTTILYRCNDVLSEEAKKNLIENVLKLEKSEFSDKTPNIPLLSETENHILLINSSRYLKNKYLYENEKNTTLEFDNNKNGLEEKLLAKLMQIKATGLDEYNSIPYIAYSITALLNLHDFGSLPIQKAAKAVLDDITDRYAHASCGLKTFFPFRRQKSKKRLTSLNYSYQLKSLYKWLPDHRPTWMTKNEGSYKNDSRTLLPGCLSYRLPDETKDRLIGVDQTPYLTQITHSKTAIGGSPEIYYGGFAKDKKYLLSAGGAYPKGIYQEQREIIVRPTTLLLDDEKIKLEDVFYLGTNEALTDPCQDAEKRNNTGVYQNFACAACPVHIPKNNEPITILQGSKWALHKGQEGLLVAVYSTDTLGVIVTFEDREDRAKLLKDIHEKNPNPATSFTFPDGKTLSYDTTAPCDQWVMKAETSPEGKIAEFERDFSKWDACKNNTL